MTSIYALNGVCQKAKCPSLKPFSDPGVDIRLRMSTKLFQASMQPKREQPL